MSRFLSSRYKDIAPYKPGEQPKGGTLLKLNTNESPYPPSPAVIAAVSGGISERLNLYSDPSLSALLAALAKRFDVSEKNVLASNGSDEMLAFCMLAFSENGFTAPDLTYGFYPVLARLFSVDYRVLPLDGSFKIRTGDYKNLNTAIILANPNAPTGEFLPVSEIERILVSNPNSLVIVDEAYVDFGGESCAPLTKIYDRLLVVGTFSKAWSMAGARIGYAVGCEGLINDLQKIRMSFHPYNINSLSAAAAVAALGDEEYFADCRRRVISTRESVSERLRALGFKLTDSLANFVFCSHESVHAEYIYEKLRAQGVLTRYFPGGRTGEYLRVSIGSDMQMDEFIEKTEYVLKSGGMKI